MSDANTASAGIARLAATTRLAVIALIVAAFAIACSPVFVRLSEVGPTVTAFYRTSLGLPVLASWYAMERRHNPHPTLPGPTDRWLLWLAGFCFAGDLVCWHWAIRLTTVANATLLASMSPIVVTLGAWYLFEERITRGFLIALGGALTGSVILTGGGVAMNGALAGAACALGAALFYAGYFLALRHIRNQVTTALAMLWSGFACSFFLLPVAWLSGETLMPVSLHGWILLIGLALVSQILGQSLLGWAMGHLPVSYSSVSLLLQPVISILLAAAMLGEAVTLKQISGGTIIMLSIIAARRSSLRAALPSTAAGA